MKSTSGFTLIELLTVITILGVLISSLLMIFNPQTQIRKGEDSKRRTFLSEIKGPLLTYYDDYKCFPTTLPWGSDFTSGTNTYFSELPLDDASDGPFYKNDGTTCPQWYVVAWRKEYTLNPDMLADCQLRQTNPCDTNISDEFVCSYEGSVDCSAVTIP